MAQSIGEATAIVGRSTWVTKVCLLPKPWERLYLLYSLAVVELPKLIESNIDTQAVHID